MLHTLQQTLPPHPTPLPPTKRQVPTPRRTRAIDPHHPAFQLLAHAHRALQIIRVHRCIQPEFRIVGERERFGFGGEGVDGYDGAEDFGGGEGRGGGEVGEDDGVDE